MDGRHEVFPAAFIPFHRTPGLHGQPGNDAFFTVDVKLAAESSADFGSDHPHGGFWQADQQRNLRFQKMRNLGRGPYRKAILAGQIFGDDRARLHRYRRQTLVHHALLDDAISFFECGLDVTIF